jgi:hypothetical protein
MVRPDAEILQTRQSSEGLRMRQLRLFVAFLVFVTGSSAASQLETAAELARQLSSPSMDERTKGVRTLAETVGLGIYSGSGSVLLRGLERGPDDFFLYDFEVPLLALMSDSSDQVDYGQLSSTLDLRGPLRDKFGTPEKLHQLICASAQAALSHSEDRESFLMLVIRELGLAFNPPYDLAASPPISDVNYTRFQEWLISNDLLLPVFWSRSEPSLSPSAAGQTMKVTPRIAGAQPRADLDHPPGAAGVTLDVATGVVSSAADFVVPDSLSTAVQAEHALVLRRLLRIKPLESTFSFQYDSPARPVRFEVFCDARGPRLGQ